MVRKVNVVKADRDPKASTVPKTKPKGKKGVTFRTPHPELVVVIVKSERIDQGAGSYSIVPPKTVDFENHGNYGEATVDLETANLLRKVADERKERMLPPKFIEV